MRGCVLKILFFSFLVPSTMFAQSYTYKNNSAMSRVYSQKNYKMEKVAACENGICDPFRFLFTVSGGAGFVKMGESETFTAAGINYSYDPDTGSQTQKMWGASVGEEFRFAGGAVDLTVGYYQLASIRAEGSVTQESSTYSYQYNVNSKQYLVEAKYLGDMNGGLHFYGLVGIGASINQLGHYAISSSTISDPPIFDSDNDYNFAYSLGIGLDYDIIRYARIGLGYRFLGLGPAELGASHIGLLQTSNTIGQTNLNAQEVLLQLTLIA